uniref:Uncharacterized protein n=1 Tax=viral metagenome TaxID=1070528 RepID=A0A6H1ZW96_9ZZZZ
MTTQNRNAVDTVVCDTLFVNDYASLPAGFVTNAMVQASAGIEAEKLESYQVSVHAQAGTCVTETKVLAIIRGATGLSLGVEATNAVACSGSSTVTCDVKKNGASILSAAITLNSSSSTTVPVEGTVGTTALVDGDIITSVITANQSGTDALASGVAVQYDYNVDHPDA